MFDRGVRVEVGVVKVIYDASSIFWRVPGVGEVMKRRFLHTGFICLSGRMVAWLGTCLIRKWALHVGDVMFDDEIIWVIGGGFVGFW